MEEEEKKEEEEKEIDEKELNLEDKFTSILKTVVPKRYSLCRFNRNFEFSELWFIRKGSLKIQDDIKGDIYELSAGDLIIFPAGSKTKIVIKEDSLIKQCFFDSVRCGTGIESLNGLQFMPFCGTGDDTHIFSPFRPIFLHIAIV